MSHGSVDHRRNKRDRALRDNAAIIPLAAVRLQCGHEVNSQPAVSTTPGKPDLFFCPEGCGLSPGTRRKGVPR